MDNRIRIINKSNLLFEMINSAKDFILMIISIHQPNYLPYLGFFHKMTKCDIFVFLDNVEFVDNFYQQRNKIKTPQGWSWLTVPVKHGYTVKPYINEIEIAIEQHKRWGVKHWKSIISNYGRANYFKKYADWLENIYCNENWEKLVDINETIIKDAARLLGINVQFVRASDLNVNGKRTELLVNICKSLNADAYLSGVSGINYLDTGLFAKDGIELLFHSYDHPVYKQCFGGFKPNMCVLDLMFNYGDDSLDILTRQESKC